MIKSIGVFLVFTCSFAYAQTVNEMNISFKSKSGIILMGTLVTPFGSASRKAFPAILLLPGSGPTDRNGNQPSSLITDLLKQIAAALAKNGIASFRFDKRAAHINKMQWPSDEKQLATFFSWQNHLADAEAAYSALKVAKGIDTHRLAILGHSEGGLLALSMLKTLSPNSLILLGTPGRTLSAIMTEQISALLDQQKAPPNVKADYLAKNEKIKSEIIRTGVVPKGVPDGLKALYPLSASDYLKDVLELNPIPFAKSFKGPVLIMNGASDTQVSATRDAAVLFSAFEGRKGSKQDIFIVPSASHNFKKIANPKDPGFAGDFAPAAQEKLVSWLLANL